MESNFEISIIIPVYNVEKYIKKCLDSVLNQFNSKIQIIIINDGSTDNSHKIIEKYLEKHKNILYIIQENQGLSMARNNGLKYVQGKYVMFLDSDDYIEEDSIQGLYKHVTNKDSDIAIFGYRKVYDAYENIGYSKLNTNFDDEKIYNGKIVAKNMLTGYIDGYCCNKIFSYDYIVKNKFKFKPGVYFEDFFPVFKQVYKSEKIGFYNKVIYNYRQREESISNSKNKKLLDDFKANVKDVLNYIEVNNIVFPEECIQSYKIQGFNFMVTIFYELNKDNKNLYKNFYNDDYSLYEVSFIDVLKNKHVKIKTKVSVLLWKLRLYGMGIDTLRSIQSIIKFRFRFDL